MPTTFACSTRAIRWPPQALTPHRRRPPPGPRPCAEAYKDIDKLVLTIDGLQPEKGHETLYVVRELRGKRVWFAEALLSSGAEEVRRLIAKAKEWAEKLSKPVELWMSDKQDEFVIGFEEEGHTT